MLNRIWIGIKRNPIKLLTTIFVAYATLWTGIEPLLTFIHSLQPYFSGGSKFFLLIGFSCIAGVYAIATPKQAVMKIGNTIIRIIFDDLFSFDGYKVIPVSQFFFETEIIETSLQAKIIRQFVEKEEGTTGINKYRTKLANALKGKAHQEVTRMTKQKEKLYPLGATALLELNGNKYLLFALTQTELKGHIPHDNCSVTKMWTALDTFWREARVHARGGAVNIPLLGSGSTGINLPPSRILELNLLAIQNALIEGGKITTGEIRIILHPTYFEDIDLNQIRNSWN